MLSGILPFSPGFSDEWGMSLSSPIKKKQQIFLKPKSLILGKWCHRGGAVGFTGRGSRASPPGSLWPSPSRRSAGRPWTAASHSPLPVPAVHCSQGRGRASPQERSQAALSAPPSGTCLAGMCVGSSHLGPKVTRKQL